MRILTFMSLGEAKSEVDYDDLCKELNIGVDEIEEFVIEGRVPNCICLNVCLHRNAILTRWPSG